MSDVVSELKGHIKALESGKRKPATCAVLIEIPSDGGLIALTTFGMGELPQRHVVAVLCDTITRLSQVAASYNAQASN